jgi:hypothetical protein
MSTDTGLDIGRHVKARRIAAAIRSLGGGAVEARLFSDAEWLLADKLSRKQTGRGYVLQVDGKDKPPSDVTRALVIKYLELGGVDGITARGPVI